MTETLPQLLFEHARRTPNKIALRERSYGIWQALTWREYAEHVKHFALGLIQLGLQPSETVAIVGDNRPEWVITELAAQAAGARSIGLYQDAVVSEMLYIFHHADVSFVVVEDQEQVDKVLEMWPELQSPASAGKNVRKVIYYDPKGLRNYTEECLLPFTEVEALGRQYEQAHPGEFEARVAQGAGSDLAILSTTSGTTGHPKLAMLTHHNLLSMARNLLKVDPVRPDDNVVSFLPLAWIGEQMITLSCALAVGFTVNFPEEPETVQHDIREIGPQLIVSPPRIWENLVSQVQVGLEDSSRLKKALYHWAMPVGYRMADSRFRKEKPSLALRLQYALADGLIFQAIKDRLGLRRLRRSYTGGAALGPDVFRFFHALGVNLKQLYGQTETSGISVVHRDGDVKFQSVGTPLPETEIRIDESGEVLVRSSAVMQGYYRNPEATAETLRDGWLHSGDAGYFDEDGHLIVIDRAKDVMTLHDGTKFSPQFIENKLKFSAHIKEAVVFGGDWPFVTAMINIDFGNVGKWAEGRQIAYTTYTDLAQKLPVYALVRDQIERANGDLPPAARIRRFLLLHKELDADDAELTRTRKVRRRLVAQRYDDLISALYSHNEHVDVQNTITYQDGRTATLQTRLKIESLNGNPY
jgi:long-chain acyl-CoA synthetase